MKYFLASLFIFLCSLFIPHIETLAAPSIQNVSDNVTTSLGTYEKMEITFDISNTAAQNFFLPYDPSPPAGIDPSYTKHQGITVFGLFLPPGQTNWNNAIKQPAFYYQVFDESLKNQAEQQSGRTDWYLPTNEFHWKVRFSPHQSGTWKYKMEARDASGSFVTPEEYSFIVTDSSNKGFLKVSEADSRYFEFDNGENFIGNGWHNGEGLGVTESGTDFTRKWYSTMYGTAWTPYQGTRNQYNGYLPRAGMFPILDPDNDRHVFTRRIDLNTDGNTGWFDQCMFHKWDDTPAVKPSTTYKISVRYQGVNITANGPKDATKPGYGFVVKFSDCNNGPILTTFGRDTNGTWGTVTGSWTSTANQYFMPRVVFTLDNLNNPTDPAALPQAYYYDISFREDLGNGQLGPEIMVYPSIDHHLYVAQEKAYILDKSVEDAEQKGVYTKWVLMEKNDEMYAKMDYDGTLVYGGEPDNLQGFYGNGRTDTHIRWFQKAWWRYAQARWGYSPSIHSWEVTNEGDPFRTAHYQMTDEMGKFFKCEVFDIPIGDNDGQVCTYDHPNDHMVTTSFWHSFPATAFWKNTNYPNVDYADVHAYISTSQDASCQEKYEMQYDAALYHRLHSERYAGWNIGKPIVRGEAGMDGFIEDPAGNCTIIDGQGVSRRGRFQQSQSSLGITRDTQGIWVHNYVWAKLYSGGLFDLYWWHEHLISSTFDHRHHFKPYYLFMQGIPLNNGNYVDAAATVSNSNIRAWGQKDLTNGNAHLWIQNKNHTWKKVVDGLAIAPENATITLSGFQPGKKYTIEWWNTYSGAISNVETEKMANQQGEIVLSVSGLGTDTAVKVMNPDVASVTPSPSVTQTQTPGDTDADGDVDIFDYNTVISHFGQAVTGASNGDLDNDGDVDIFDYNLVISNFGR